MKFQMFFGLSFMVLFTACQDRQRNQEQLSKIQNENREVALQIELIRQKTPKVLPASELEIQIARLEEERQKVILEDSKVLKDLRAAKQEHQTVVETMDAFRKSFSK